MTLYDLALRTAGECERPGDRDAPFILWCLEAVGFVDARDEVPWCSAWLSRMAWLMRLPRSKSAMARSWLNVGTPIPLEQARPGWDVVVLSRGEPPSGHVGLFAGLEGDTVLVLGGNQGDAVSIARFPVARLLGVRRLTEGGPY